MKFNFTGKKKIAVLAQQGLGDLIMELPLFVGLMKKATEETEIFVLLSGKTAQSILDSRFPNNKFHYLYLDGKSSHRQIQFLKYALYLRKQKIDLLLTYGFFVSDCIKAMWIMAVNAKETVTSVRIPVLKPSKIVYLDVSKPILHKSDLANLYLKNIGIEEQLLSPEYPINSELQKELKGKLFSRAGQKTSYIAIVPGCSVEAPERRWPADCYIELCEKILKRNSEYVFLFIGNNENEKNMIEYINKSLPQKTYLNLFNNDYETNRAVFSLCEYVIGIDSGGLNMASTVLGPKIIGLFGPSNPKISGVKFSSNLDVVTSKIECGPCLDWRKKSGPSVNRCRKYLCMERITSDDVIKKLNTL